jgi:hypothetical protein
MMYEGALLNESQMVWPGAKEAATSFEVSQFDYDLARRIASGDMCAFEEFYQRYHRRVYTLYLRMTRNEFGPRE